MRLLPSTFILLPMASFLHLLTFLLLSVDAHGSAGVCCIEKEKRALIDFKLSFVADPYNTLSTWRIRNKDCCNWVGVTCSNHTGHVTSLHLSYDDLKSYQLRRSILKLQHLISLDLSGNTFTMRIPKFLGSLSQLTHLDLSYSEFIGEIPPQLASLSRLQYLDLSNSNGLYANNWEWLSHLSSLQTLNLFGVDLSKATDWASSLQRLPTLVDFRCKSCSLPPPSLSSLSHCNFSTSLQYLDLSNNSMSSSTLSCLINATTNFQSIYLDNAKLEDNLDEFLKALFKRARYSLEDLYLARNNLSGNLSKILHSLPPNLANLDLSSNLLSGVISDVEFFKFSQLKFLSLSNNMLLTFNFSKSWVPPFQLQSLDMSSCKVGPSFPNWILTQNKLQHLDISNSMISGAIPNIFWQTYSALEYLNISHNKIESKIPNVQSPIFCFENLDLSSNMFYGSIPLFMFNATFLDLSNNNFSRFSPLHSRALISRSVIINLSSNRLTDPLPDWFFQLPELYVLNLENNNMSGSLSGEIGSLHQLSALHLSNNHFSGQLPLSMKNCTRLAILELASNEFSGVLPSWLGESMTQLAVLTLRSNHFIDYIPSTLCHLQSLQILDLSENQLSGMIPDCLHNLSSMSTSKDLNHFHVYEYETSYEEGPKEVSDYASVMWKGALWDLYARSLYQRTVINLSGNRLAGGIPVGVTALKELRSLDLSRNHLNGSIPDKIGQLMKLELLKLSSNRLYGKILESLADLTFLGTLNLSENNLSGRIPTSTQLRDFDASSYAGNPNLCGEPLPSKCPGDEDSHTKPPSAKDVDHDDESFDIQAFTAASGSGFAFGLLGILGALHFNRWVRVSFFQIVDYVADRIVVATSLYKSRITRSHCLEGK